MHTQAAVLTWAQCGSKSKDLNCAGIHQERPGKRSLLEPSVSTGLQQGAQIPSYPFVTLFIFEAASSFLLLLSAVLAPLC